MNSASQVAPTRRMPGSPMMMSSGVPPWPRSTSSAERMIPTTNGTIDRPHHVMSLVRDARGGRDNDPNFGSRMRGTGAYAELIRARFKVASRKLGLDPARERPLDATLFRPPGPRSPQLQLEL